MWQYVNVDRLSVTKNIENNKNNFSTMSDFVSSDKCCLASNGDLNCYLKTNTPQYIKIYFALLNLPFIIFETY